MKWEPPYPEAALQRQVVSWLRILEQTNRGTPREFLFYHPHNTGARKPKLGKQMKDLGVRPGIADIAFILPGGRAGFIELKVGGGYMGDAQEEFQARCLKIGARHEVARSLEGVQRIVKEWGLA